VEASNIDNIANQVTIESPLSLSAQSKKNNNRLEFINSQRKNRYPPSNCPPFLVHIESTDGNIRNVHETEEGPLADHFPTIQSIRKLGKNIVAVNFKFSFDANHLSNQMIFFLTTS